jgi:dienelactone hydrolase
MTLRRRTVLGLGLAGAASAGVSALGVTQALGDPLARPSQSAPADPFAIGVREFAWSRGPRRLTTRIFYPATGSPGGEPVRDAPLADGVFPVCEFSHGLGGNPESYGPLVRPLAEAGFIVPAPVFPTTSSGTEGNVGDVYNGNQSMDVSEVITQTLALNDAAGDPFAGRIAVDAGVGVAGHSLGGMTTHGLLTAWPDDRITAAVPFACIDMGDPAVAAKVLFVHGDQDTLTRYDLARQAYAELAAPKAFMTHTGIGHDEYIWGDANPDATVTTYVDWMRWSLYGDTAARDRLAEDAAVPGVVWEADLAVSG